MQAADSAADTSLLSDMQEWFSRESQELATVLQQQSAEDAVINEWEERKARDAQLLAMYREASLLSELNVAWIQDQLDHWDCRVAEQAGLDVQQRQMALLDYGAQLQALCAQVGPNDSAQQRVCQTQEQQLSGAYQELASLAQHFAGECTAAERQTGAVAPEWSELTE